MEENTNEIIIEKKDKEKNLKELLGIEKWLELNAKLSQKKNKARNSLTEMGVLKKKGKNTYDNYKYFTEAQYKDVANKLLSNAGLELKVTEKEYFKYSIQNSKTPIGRIVAMIFTLTDMETGFYEESIIRGEGLDRGDKAGYKAYTGAIKYYLANTFLIPTGDDPEKESPNYDSKAQEKKVPTKKENLKIQKTQIEIISKFYNDENMDKLLKANGLERLEDMSLVKASEIITKLKENVKKDEVKENE